jgi:hypothetical protein
MKTIEGNKLIAEFEGHKINFGFNKDAVLYVPSGKGNTTNNSVRIQETDLQYHSSWSWLMPVVEEINNDFDVRIMARYCEVMTDDGDVITQFTSETTIEAVWQAIVEWIKWDNENK